MTNLSPEICKKIKEARREAGLSQSLLAQEVGCKQSALSMFEQGDGTKINDEVIEKLCAKFGIELKKSENSAAAVSDFILPAKPAFSLPASEISRGFCPNTNCPSHQRYTVEGRMLLKPNREIQDPVGGKFCAVCGELLERVCPTCGSPVHEGAICSFCGRPYLALA